MEKQDPKSLIHDVPNFDLLALYKHELTLTVQHNAEQQVHSVQRPSRRHAAPRRWKMDQPRTERPVPACAYDGLHFLGIINGERQKSNDRS